MLTMHPRLVPYRVLLSDIPSASRLRRVGYIVHRASDHILVACLCSLRLKVQLVCFMTLVISNNHHCDLVSRVDFHGLFRQANSFFIDPLQGFYEGVTSLPSHRSSPSQGRLDGVQEGAVPVPFQDAPAPFKGIVFAVIRRRVNQLNRQLMTVCEFDQPLDELGAMAGKLRAVI
jgi:hypothetical protein